jgi:hypothetical protein
MCMYLKRKSSFRRFLSSVVVFEVSGCNCKGIGGVVHDVPTLSLYVMVS